MKSAVVGIVLNVIVSGGFSAPYREVLPEFERATGIKVTTTSGQSLGADPNTIGPDGPPAVSSRNLQCIQAMRA